MLEKGFGERGKKQVSTYGVIEEMTNVADGGKGNTEQVLHQLHALCMRDQARLDSSQCLLRRRLSGGLCSCLPHGGFQTF